MQQRQKGTRQTPNHILPLCALNKISVLSAIVMSMDLFCGIKIIGIMKKVSQSPESWEKGSHGRPRPSWTATACFLFPAPARTARWYVHSQTRKEQTGWILPTLVSSIFQSKRTTQSWAVSFKSSVVRVGSDCQVELERKSAGLPSLPLTP